MALSDRVVVMSKGVIEQVDTPFRIYNYPATEFVASFVGKLNQLPCTVVDPATGLLRFGQTDVRTADEITQPAGAAVTLMLRPEELDVDGAEENQIAGRVESVSFLGAIIRVIVDVSGSKVTADLFNERLLKLPEVDDDVQVSFPAHACWVIS
jgi:putative spermidine/putrescine transport system ATP-binding protein